MSYIISGIQQVGVGVPDVYKAWEWYRKNLGMNIRIFDDASVAELMLPYTGGEPRERHAVLAMNMRGGGGFEIWQHKGKTPEPIKEKILLGDLGINITKLKTADIEASFNQMKKNSVLILGDIHVDPDGRQHFFIEDPYENVFQIIEEEVHFTNVKKFPSGGVFGVVVGVSDIDNSLHLYQEVLGYNELVYDETQEFDDFKCLNGGTHKQRRVLLRHSNPRKGGFSPMLGPTEIELIQVVGREPVKIFQDRMWGDPGFIHLCFDIRNMEALRDKCESDGYKFTVDSANSFDMGQAAGHFSYIEDKDGTLIEFVETYRVPIMKKMGWFVDMSKRPNEKALPKWLMKAMAVNKVK